MGKFYGHQLRKTDEYTYTAVPKSVWGVYVFLEDHHIPYEIIGSWGLAPAGTELGRAFAFADELGGPKDDVCIIKAKVNSDDLFEIARETVNLSPKEIGDEFTYELPPVLEKKNRTQKTREEEIQEWMTECNWTREEAEAQLLEFDKMIEEEHQALLDEGMSETEIERYYEKCDKAHEKWIKEKQRHLSKFRFDQKYLTHFED